jgi:hypothetical protein
VKEERISNKVSSVALQQPSKWLMVNCRGKRRKIENMVLHNYAYTCMTSKIFHRFPKQRENPATKYCISGCLRLYYMYT